MAKPPLSNKKFVDKPKQAVLGTPSVIASIKTSREIFDTLLEAWAADQVPFNHRSKFIEAVQELKFDLMNQVLLKEISDFKAAKSQI
jgi:hypothetical protein